MLVAVEVYFSVCLLSLASAYGLRVAGMSVEDYLLRPGWAPALRVVLLPYLALGGVALYLSRWFDREGLLNPVAPGLFIGRLPFPFDRLALREAGIGGVLNLCWEFPRSRGSIENPGSRRPASPILDGAPPTDRQFGEAVAWVAVAG